VKIVTVHRGARDGYHVARALAEAGLLETLVTDLYWPSDRSWARGLDAITRLHYSELLQRRHAENVPSDCVKSCWGSGASSLLLSKMDRLPFTWKRKAVRWCDNTLGQTAGRIASERGAALLSYSYYGHSAFSRFTGKQPRILFQLHPHPVSVRTILEKERQLYPDCAASLDKEWELALPEADFNRLAEEPSMADYWLAASQFTKRTLTDAGIPGERIAVVPYGTDLSKFAPGVQRTGLSGRPLRLLFVGTLGQRKGVRYLLEALETFSPGAVELTLCGRPVDDLSLFRNARVAVRVCPSISEPALLEAYRHTDLFVFPSLAEGFGHVLLEAMASGLPILATDRTAAPDLIRHGEEGFLLKAGSSSDLAFHIEKFLSRPALLKTMGAAARNRAEFFTWSKFRQGVVDFVDSINSGAAQTRTLQPCSRY
jgi:glycosyltransferase involved in cell wall biosynthesis